jgi:hypothetical protein
MSRLEPLADQTGLGVALERHHLPLSLLDATRKRVSYHHNEVAELSSHQLINLLPCRFVAPSPMIPFNNVKILVGRMGNQLSGCV